MAVAAAGSAPSDPWTGTVTEAGCSISSVRVGSVTGLKSTRVELYHWPLFMPMLVGTVLKLDSSKKPEYAKFMVGNKLGGDTLPGLRASSGRYNSTHVIVVSGPCLAC